MKILFLVSSIGLGHARRSLKVVEKLKEQRRVEVTWLAGEPVLRFLREHGQEVHNLSRELSSLSPGVEKMEREAGRINIGIRNGVKLIGSIRHNAMIAKEAYAQVIPDLVIGDEAWEIAYWRPNCRVVFLTDFIRYTAGGLIAYVLNKVLIRLYRSVDLFIFYGDEGEYDPGLIGPHAHHVGLPGLSRRDISDRSKIREKLGLSGRTIVVTTGGTSIGSDILRVAIEAHKTLRKEFKDLNTIIVLGPRGSINKKVPDGVKLLGFVKDLPSLMYSSDCVITQAGTASLSEIASLGVRCIAIPIEEHFEQLENIRRFSIFENIEFLPRRDLTPELLSMKARECILSKPLPFKELNGAGRAAEVILHYIDRLGELSEK